MNKNQDKIRRRSIRKLRIRKKIAGTAERPRMSVFKSNKHLYVQVIDDGTKNTLVAISNLEKELAQLKVNKEGAEKLGESLGTRLKDKNITTVVFDRNGYQYHGVIKAVADGVRKAGIVL